MPKMKGCLEEEIKLYYPIEVGEEGTKKTVTKITIREMTGYDEEDLSQSQYRTNPPLWLRRLIWRCIVDADGSTLEMDDVYKIKSVDTDNIILKLRILSSGTELETPYECKCGYKSKAVVKLDELVFVDPNPKITSVPFTLIKPYVKTLEDGKTIELKEGVVNTVTDGKFQEEMFKKFNKSSPNIGEMKTSILLNTVVFKGGVKLSDKDFKSMTQRQRNQLSKIIEDNKAGYDFRESLSCPKCSANVDLVISPFSFFG